MSDEKPKGNSGQFKPGQSGNPGGQVKGTRHRLNAAFLTALNDDFNAHGKKAIEQCRKNNPAAYVRSLVALLPKEIEVKRPLEEFDDAELIAAVRALQSFLAAQSAESGVGAPGEPAKTH